MKWYRASWTDKEIITGSDTERINPKPVPKMCGGEGGGDGDVYRRNRGAYQGGSDCLAPYKCHVGTSGRLLNCTLSVQVATGY